jgi:hypothetical protein
MNYDRIIVGLRVTNHQIGGLSLTVRIIARPIDFLNLVPFTFRGGSHGVWPKHLRSSSVFLR